MKVKDSKVKYSPSDLNNFVNCKYHIYNDLVEHEQKLKKKVSVFSLDLIDDY